MQDTMRSVKETSVSSENVWLPNDRFGAKLTVKETKNEFHCGVPDLTKMREKWRIEREEIISNKEKQKKELLTKKTKDLEKRKKNIEEKSEMGKNTGVPSQNTLKKINDFELLLDELEFFENEGKNLCGLSVDSKRHFIIPHYDKYAQPELPEFDVEKGKNNILSIKKNFRTWSDMMSVAGGETQKFSDCRSKTVVYKKLIEEVFMRLKKQQDCESYSSLNASPYKDNFFKESYEILRKLYEKKLKTLNFEGREDTYLVQYTFQSFPPFPSSVEELDVLSNNPLIFFREWCQFHKLTPIPFEKTTKESLVNDYTSSSANNYLRLRSLCTLIHLYHEFYPTSTESQETEIVLIYHDLQTPLANRSDELGNILNSTLKSSYGKVQLGTALALAFTGRSNENRDIVSSTLMSAVKGITSVEKRIAAVAMAYAGIFEHSALHVLLEEWKTAQYAHTLQQYLTALRWLSIHENSIIRSVAEYLNAQNVHMHLCVCLTLPFLEGNLPVTVKDTLIHLMCNSSAYIVQLAAARVLECKQRGDCVQEHILKSMTSSNILKALEVIQLSLMLKHINPQIAGILLPCLYSNNKYVKMIGLNVVEKLQINNSNIIEALNQAVFDKDSEVRESALNTFRHLDVPGSKVESLVSSALICENDECVYTALLKLIEATGFKGKTIQKSLQNSFKKPHNRENKQLILNLLEIINSEPDVSSNKSMSVSKLPGRYSRKSEKSNNSNVTCFSERNTSQLQKLPNTLENRDILNI